MGNVFNMVGGGWIRLESLEVTTPPTKTEYLAGETFSTAGMIVTATYTNGATAQATGYTYDTSPLQGGMTGITLTYTESGVTRETVVPIIVRIVVPIPTWDGAEIVYKATIYPKVSGDCAERGATQYPTFVGYDAETMDITEGGSGVNAGDYMAVFVLKDPDNYRWADGTNGTPSVDWKISKAQGWIGQGTKELSFKDITFGLEDVSHIGLVVGDTTMTGILSVYWSSSGFASGAISVESSDPDIYTYSIDFEPNSGSTTVGYLNCTGTYVGKKAGKATITITVAESENYTERVYTFTATFTGYTLEALETFFAENCADRSALYIGGRNASTGAALTVDLSTDEIFSAMGNGKGTLLLTAFYGGLSVDLLYKDSDGWHMGNLYQYQYNASYYPEPSLSDTTLTIPYTKTNYRYGYTVVGIPIQWTNMGGIYNMFKEHLTATRLASSSASSTAACSVDVATALGHQLVLGACKDTVRLIDKKEAAVCDGLNDEYALYHSDTSLYARTSSSSSVYAANIIALDVTEESA
jgi:hypothetical protein